MGKTHCGRVLICLDGLKNVCFLNSYVSRSPLRRTVQSDLHIMILSYYIGMCVFHERQHDMTSVKHNVLEVSIFDGKNCVFFGLCVINLFFINFHLFPRAKALSSFNGGRGGLSPPPQNAFFFS